MHPGLCQRQQAQQDPRGCIILCLFFKKNLFLRILEWQESLRITAWHCFVFVSIIFFSELNSSFEKLVGHSLWLHSAKLDQELGGVLENNISVN